MGLVISLRGGDGASALLLSIRLFLVFLFGLFAFNGQVRCEMVKGDFSHLVGSRRVGEQVLQSLVVFDMLH